MKLTKGLIKADIIAAKQAIEYFEENNYKEFGEVSRINEWNVHVIGNEKS